MASAGLNLRPSSNENPPSGMPANDKPAPKLPTIEGQPVSRRERAPPVNPKTLNPKP